MQPELHTYVHHKYFTMFTGCTFSNGPNRKLPKCPSAAEWGKKLWLSSHSEIPYSSENKHSVITRNNTEGSHKHDIERKKPDIKRHILYDSMYLKFKTRPN